MALHRRAAPPESARGVQWLRRDLADLRGLTEGLPPVDAVVHLAQSARFRDFPDGAPDVFAVNVASTERLLEWARATGARRFVLASSGGRDLQRELGDGPLPPPGPLEHYLASKRAAELLVEGFAAAMRVAVLRLFFVYGAGQRPTMLVPRLARAIARGDAVTLQGQEGVRLRPLHVEDAARALEGALALEEDVRVSVAGPDECSIRELAELLGARLGRAPRFEVRAEPPGSMTADISAMIRLFGHARVRLRDGLEEVCREVERPA